MCASMDHVRGMRGEGVLQFQLYYINQWLALAFQRLEMWNSVIQRVSWALEFAETNGLQAGSDKGRMVRDQQDQEEQEAFLYCSGG